MSTVNPFSTSAIRPGAIPYRFFDPAVSTATLVDRFLNQLHRHAAIVGPHGSGKSTLLESLVPKLQEAMGQTQWLKVKRSADAPWTLNSNCKLLVIDGFEQLYGLKRLRWIVAAKRQRVGLLVTSHRPSRWIPTLHESPTGLKYAQSLLQDILADHPELREPFEVELSRIWPRFAPNTREAFFALYDYYEENYRGS